MRTKRYQEAKSKVDPKKLYSIDEAVELIKTVGTTAFDAAVEFHVRLGIDPGKSDQQVRGTVTLPNGTGKVKRVAAFVEAEKEGEAKAAGADLFGGEELIEKIGKSGQLDFDVAIATPVMMPKLAKLAKILGPKGLMPNPKTDTIGPNVTKMVQEQKAGKVSYKNDDTGNIHQVIGRMGFDSQKLKENLTVLIESIRKGKPPSSKGVYFRNAVICSTMSPAIHVDIPTL